MALYTCLKKKHAPMTEPLAIVGMIGKSSWCVNITGLLASCNGTAKAKWPLEPLLWQSRQNEPVPCLLWKQDACVTLLRHESAPSHDWEAKPNENMWSCIYCQKGSQKFLMCFEEHASPWKFQHKQLLSSLCVFPPYFPLPLLLAHLCFLGEWGFRV